MFKYIYARPLFSTFLLAVVCVIAYAFLNALFKDRKWIKFLSLFGVLLSVFLPPVFMVIIEAVLVCGVGILFII